jgi:hypothetical protein
MRGSRNLDQKVCHLKEQWRDQRFRIHRLDRVWQLLLSNNLPLPAPLSEGHRKLTGGLLLSDVMPERVMTATKNCVEPSKANVSKCTMFASTRHEYQVLLSHPLISLAFPFS